MTEERIKHRIKRHEAKLQRLEAIGENLSPAGHWSKGYEDGVLTILYDWLDDIRDNKEKKL